MAPGGIGIIAPDRGRVEASQSCGSRKSVGCWVGAEAGILGHTNPRVTEWHSSSRMLVVGWGLWNWEERNLEIGLARRASSRVESSRRVCGSRFSDEMDFLTGQ